MRTISIQLDDRTDALLRLICERQGLSRASALRAAIEHLAEVQRPSPADLAARLGLIGSFMSGKSGRAVDHSRAVKRQLRTRLASDSA